MNSTPWENALNFVDEKVQELKHLGYGYLAKRPYRSELRESNTHVVFTLFADPLSDTVIRAVVLAQTTDPQPLRTFSHGFDMHRDGRVEGLSETTLRAFQ